MEKLNHVWVLCDAGRNGSCIKNRVSGIFNMTVSNLAPSILNRGVRSPTRGPPGMYYAADGLVYTVTVTIIEVVSYTT
jgi:hypothetical protein